VSLNLAAGREEDRCADGRIVARYPPYGG